MNRRQFLNKTSSVTAGALAATAIREESYAQSSPNETINVAVVGIRSRGRAHYAAYEKIPNVRVSHVVDVSEYWSRLPVFQSLRPVRCPTKFLRFWSGLGALLVDF